MQVYFYNEQITTYYITEDGRLFNKKTGNWLKGQISKNGYHTYQISIDGEKKRLYAHRMVAETYIIKPKGKTEVNHKDCNKLNNSVYNLEWVTSSENKQHGIENGLYNNGKEVFCFDKDKNLLCTYTSIASAARLLKINTSWLSEQLNREVKTLSHGFYWSYSKENTFKTKLTNGVGKPIGKYTVDGTLLQKYESRNDCARQTGYDRKRIGECCNGKIKTYKGYVFKYLV